MQYADTLLIVVHCRDTNAYTNVCISTILLQLTRLLAWGSLGWLVGVKRGKKTPLRRTLSYLGIVVVVVLVVVLVVLGGRSIGIA